MKRKLTQLEMDEGASPPKLFQTTNSHILREMELLNTSPPLGRPNLASTPVSGARNGAQTRESIRQNHQHPTTFDPVAEAELRRIVDNFLNIYEQLDTCGGSDVKPNYSYTELAYLAMLRSPNFCLPINEIYSYIQSRFLFFKNSTRKHWKNAVRHSLAKTMCFTKIPVGRGKSNSENLARSMYLWCILPGSIASFARGDYRPSIDKESGVNTLRWGYFQMNAGQFWDQVGNYIAHKMTGFKRTLEQSSTPGHIFETQTCSLPVPKQPHGNQSLPLRQYHDTSANQQYSLNQNHVQYGYSQVDVQQYNTLPGLVSVPVASPQLGYVPTPSPAVCNNEYSLQLASPHSMTDPWLRKIASPDISVCSNESDRQMQQYLSFDSGNDTYESSPEKSSCRFSGSCAKPNSCERLSPQPSSFPVHSFNDSGFNQVDLSALGDLDFSPNPSQNCGEVRYTPNFMSEMVNFNAPLNYSVHRKHEPANSGYIEAFESSYLSSCNMVQPQVHVPENSFHVSHPTAYFW